MKKIRIGCFVLSLMCIAWSLLMVFFPYLNNWKLVLQGKDNAMLREEPLTKETMECFMDEFYDMLDAKSTGIHAQVGWPVHVTIQLKHDVRYYLSPEDKEPVYVAKAGEWYYCSDQDFLYGFATFPTRDVQWRYSRPFESSGREITKEEYVNSDIRGEHSFDLPYYFVPYEDLARNFDLMPYLSWKSSWEDYWMGEYDFYYTPLYDKKMWDEFNRYLLIGGGSLFLIALLWQLLANRSRKLGWILSLVFIGTSLLQIFVPTTNNWKLVLQGRKNIYLTGRSAGLTDAGFWSGTSYEKHKVTGGDNYRTKIIPKRDVYYYEKPGDTEPAYVMEAGQTYYHMAYSGYGFLSFPTKNAGWREVIPFQMSTEYISNHPRLYIRTSDLDALASGEAATTAFEESDPERHKEILGFFQSWRRYFDDAMYEHRVYYSPDLEKLIFDVWNTGFLLIGIAILGWLTAPKLLFRKRSGVEYA